MRDCASQKTGPLSTVFVSRAAAASRLGGFRLRNAASSLTHGPSPRCVHGADKADGEEIDRCERVATVPGYILVLEGICLPRSRSFEGCTPNPPTGSVPPMCHTFAHRRQRISKQDIDTLQEEGGGQADRRTSQGLERGSESAPRQARNGGPAVSAWTVVVCVAGVVLLRCGGTA